MLEKQRAEKSNVVGVLLVKIGTNAAGINYIHYQKLAKKFLKKDCLKEIDFVTPFY